MGVRVLNFSDTHPDTDAGFVVSVGRLKLLVGRADQIATAQRDGQIDSRAASARKDDLRRAMLSRPIAHLAGVGALAAREQHELGSTFRFKPGASTFLAFRTAARSMAAAAQTHREVLMKYGLSESVLEEFGRMLDEFDAAVTLGNDGRTTHTGATRELNAVASEIAQIVQVMDARNRQRFQGDGQLLGSWISASTVLGSPRGVSGAAETLAPAVPEGGAPVGEDVRPAA
jgi:hypothetical protein